jgi:ABC-type multidrug transport system permease subunit
MIFDHFEATRANVLALLIFLGGHAFQYYFGVRSRLIGVILASLILSLVFIAVSWLVSQRASKLRLIGFVMLVFVALATFYWGELSPTALDPAPIEKSR